MNNIFLVLQITRWHDDFNVFKNGVNDLEVMLINVTQVAFDSVSCLRPRIMRVDSLQLMSVREGVKRHVTKKAVEMYGAFMQVEFCPLLFCIVLQHVCQRTLNLRAFHAKPLSPMQHTNETFVLHRQW